MSVGMPIRGGCSWDFMEQCQTGLVPNMLVRLQIYHPVYSLLLVRALAGQGWVTASWMYRILGGSLISVRPSGQFPEIL